MSSLSPSERNKFEELFGMASGYVLNFSDSTFAQFFADLADIDIHSDKYSKRGTSKAKKLREFLRIEPDPLAGKVLLELLEVWRQSSEVEPAKNERYSSCKDLANRLIASGPRLSSLKEKAATIDAHHLADQIRRMESSVNTDAALAIGTAKELIETVCKTILAEQGSPVTGTPDITTLTKETFKQLHLVPEGVPDEARGAKTIKVMLSNLATIAQGLAELRGLYGTGHGKDGRAKGLRPRHARLAVGAAATLAMFLFETHNDQKER